MADYIYTFRRIEKKYLITEEKAKMLRDRLSRILIPDAHGKSTVKSLYLDTPSYLLIRNSISAKVYKEKLRLRSYGEMTPDTNVFFEIKKKYKGVVYKRRVAMTYRDALEYIQTGEPPADSQIMREIDYAMKIYEGIRPSVLLSYEREAYFFSDLPALRLTFDKSVRYAPVGNTEEKRITEDGMVVMELKSDGAIPVWLSLILDECKIYPTRFSKYGRAYLDMLSASQCIDKIHK